MSNENSASQNLDAQNKGVDGGKALLRLNYPRTMLIGLAFFAISLFWQAYIYVVPLMLGEYIENDAVINAFLMLDNILAMALLPIIGALSDRTRTRWGKRMPYIVLFTIGAAIFFSLVALADNLKSLPLIIIFLVFSVLFMCSFRSPAVALMPDLTPKPLRSKANAMINIMGVFGGIIGSMVLATLFVNSTKTGEVENGVPVVKYDGTSPFFFIVTAAIMVVAITVLFFVIKEKKVRSEVDAECAKVGYDEASEEEQEKQELAAMGGVDKNKRKSLILILVSIFFWFMGYTAITANASRYGYAVWKTDQVPLALTIAQAAAFIAALPAGFLAQKLGRKWAIILGVCILALSFSILAMFTAYSASMFVLFGFVGIGWVTINVNSYPMVVELARGPDIGKYTGYYYFFSMSSQMISKLISGVLMQSVGYNTIFPFGAIFVALSFVTMFFVRHGNAKKVAQ